MKKENIYSILSYSILVFLMSSSICQALYTSFFMTNTLRPILFLSILAFTALFILVFYNKTSMIITACVLSLSLIICFALIYSRLGLNGTEFLFNNYLDWFLNCLNGFYYPIPSYEMFTIILLAFLATIIIYVLTVKLYNIYILLFIGFGIFLAQLAFNIFVSKNSFYLFLFSFIIYYIFDIMRRRSKNGNYSIGNKLKYFLYLLPVGIIVLLLAFQFPSRPKPVQFQWLNEKLTKVENLFNGKSIAAFDYFSIAEGGFGSGRSGYLGGNVNLSNIHVMDVKSNYSNLYLKAFSRSQYDGRKWFDNNVEYTQLGQGSSDYSKDINSDMYEFLLGSQMIGSKKSYENKYSKIAKSEVKYIDMETKSIFMPNKEYTLSFNSFQKIRADNEGMLSTIDPKSKGFSYSFSYHTILLNDKDFKKDIEKSYRGFYADYKKQQEAQHFGIAGLNNLSYMLLPSNTTENELFVYTDTSQLDIMISNADKIYSTYLSLPKTLPSRVSDLAKKVTSNEKNNYDKTKAIETYLSKNYPYTLQPGPVPRNRDFVDYFLFEGKKGYCTYYASAMVVMLRSIGIPARYVEGYILPPEQKNGVYQVTNKQSHAWVEVYFEGFGWIQFEPTSPFIANLYNASEQETLLDSEMSEPMYVDYMEMMKKYNKGGAGFDYIDENQEANKNDYNIQSIIIISALSLLGLIILSIAVLLMINTLKYIIMLRKLRKASANSSVLMSYSYILKVIKLNGLPYEPGETPHQYGARIEKFLDIPGNSFNKKSFISVTKYFEYARYSRKLITDEQKDEVLMFIPFLLSITKRRIGKRKYFFYRYVLGKL